MWHMGMRPIGQASPGGCGSANADSTGFHRRIPDSQAIPPGLSARDGKWMGPDGPWPESALSGGVVGLSPPCPRQSRVSPGVAVG